MDHNDTLEYEAHDEVDEYDVTSLNAIVIVEVDADLQQAVFAACGQAKEKNSSRKETVRGKGKMVRSSLKLVESKAPIQMAEEELPNVSSQKESPKSDNHMAQLRSCVYESCPHRNPWSSWFF